MDGRAFSSILAQIEAMNDEQRAVLLRLLSSNRPQATVRELLDGGAAGLRQCAHCGSDQVRR